LKIKLDENLGERGAALFRAAGHDVATVFEEQLCGAADRELIAACRAESRCLVTLDLDFSNPLLFKPSAYAGIAVLRLPFRAIDQDLWDACGTLVEGMKRRSIIGYLWIVQRGRIREYQPENND